MEIYIREKINQIYKACFPRNLEHTHTVHLVNLFLVKRRRRQVSGSDWIEWQFCEPCFIGMIKRTKEGTLWVVIWIEIESVWAIFEPEKEEKTRENLNIPMKFQLIKSKILTS